MKKNEVIYTEHGFLMYAISALKAGATLVKAKEHNLTTDVDSILKAVTQRTSIVFIANPNNPTGTYISTKEMRRLRAELPDNILLVIDGAYAEYVQHDDYHAGDEIVEQTDNTVMLRTFSKVHGLASLRLGWSYCSDEIALNLNKARGPFNVSSVAQSLGIEAIQDLDFIKQSVSSNNIQRYYLSDNLRKINIDVLESVANFILIRLQNESMANNLYQYLFDKGVIVRQVANYGLANYLRITIGTQEANELLVQYAQEFMNND